MEGLQIRRGRHDSLTRSSLASASLCFCFACLPFATFLRAWNTARKKPAIDALYKSSLFPVCVFHFLYVCRNLLII